MNNILVEVLADRIKAGKLKMKKVPKELKVKVQDKLDGKVEVVEPKKTKKEYKLYDGEREALLDKMLKDFGYIK